jgi:hypothetical protein
VKGEGALLPLPAAMPVGPFTVQLIRTDAPDNCWGSIITEVR